MLLEMGAHAALVKVDSLASNQQAEASTEGRDDRGRDDRCGAQFDEDRDLRSKIDAPQRMARRDPLLRIDQYQHRPLPLIRSAHPPPLLGLLTLTNLTEMTFRPLSTGSSRSLVPP